MKKFTLLILMLCVLLPIGASAQSADNSALRKQTTEPQTVVTFHFVPGNDMFYIPWNGNDTELNRLYSLVDEYRAEITGGRMPVHVDGYCASLSTAKENLHTAFVRANRVKSELITRKGLTEDNFVTNNYATAYTGLDGKSYRDMVVVTLRIPAREEPQPQPEPRPEPKQEPEPEPIAEAKPEPEPQISYPEPDPVPRYSRWSVGANVGMPFFWGDMTSMADGKTYIGFSAGIQATYQISPLLGVTLTADRMQNKAGARGYSRDYLLGADAMTYYTPQPGTTHAYKDLYSKMGMFGAGLHLDVNVNRIFGQRPNRKFTVILSPAVYGLHFSSKIHTKQGDNEFTANTFGKMWSLGLGGDVALRWNLTPTLDLQLKSGMVWIYDGDFDGITTIGRDRNNALWNTQVGVVWKIGGQRNRNMLYRR